MEVDETCIEAQTDSARKHSSEKGVGKKAAARDRLAEHSSACRISGFGGSLGDGTPCVPGICFNSGNTFDKAWTVDDDGQPLTLDEAGADGKPIAPVFDCNDKGSYRVDGLIRFMEAQVKIMPKPTVQNKNIAFIDGVGTHVHPKFVKWCVDNNWVIVLKCPYLSFCLQGPDVQGGAFAIFKTEYYRKLQWRMQAKLIKLRREQKGYSKSIVPSIDYQDMMHCLIEPWKKAFTRERSARSWATIGIIPFTQKPLWDFIEQQEKKAPQKPGPDDVSQGLANLLSHLEDMTGSSAGGSAAAAPTAAAAAAAAAGTFSGKINPAKVFHQACSEATHPNIVAHHEEQMQKQRQVADEAFDMWSKLEVPFSCCDTREKEKGLSGKHARALLLYRYNCDLTEVNKKNKKAEMLAWLATERAAEEAADNGGTSGSS